ncbi:MAG: 3-hydroxyacyl-CoA dehydrogenase NAD-binding domain-containing protein, partial [Candidatus Limnocylindrales bacterium]
MTNERAFVAGAGLMGHGIAQVLAATGREVVLYEPDLARANTGRDRIAANLERAVGKGRLDAAGRDAILGRIQPTADVAAAAEVGLVVEAVFEDQAVKAALWAELDRRAPDGAIFASNTSSIAIDRLAAAVGESRRARFVGMHFFSPVPVMPLIELIRGSATSDATEAAIRTIAADM